MQFARDINEFCERASLNEPAVTRLLNELPVRATHEYTDEPIHNGTLNALFNRVRKTPTGYNRDPHEFLILQAESDKEQLRTCADDQKQVTDAAASVVVLATEDPSERAKRIFRDWDENEYILKKSAGDDFEGAIDNWLDWHPTPTRTQTVRNASLAAMTLIYAAWDIGIASAPIKEFDREAVMENFDIEDGYVPIMIITLGYAEEESLDRYVPRRFRDPPEKIAHFGSFEPEATQAMEGSK